MKTTSKTANEYARARHADLGMREAAAEAFDEGYAAALIHLEKVMQSLCEFGKKVDADITSFAQIAKSRRKVQSCHE